MSFANAVRSTAIDPQILARSPLAPALSAHVDERRNANPSNASLPDDCSASPFTAPNCNRPRPLRARPSIHLGTLLPLEQRHSSVLLHSKTAPPTKPISSSPPTAFIPRPQILGLKSNSAIVLQRGGAASPTSIRNTTPRSASTDGDFSDHYGTAPLRHSSSRPGASTGTPPPTIPSIREVPERADLQQLFSGWHLHPDSSQR